MLTQAKGVDVAQVEPADEHRTMIVWEGFLTRFITEELHLSVPYYSSVTQALKRMGCIRQLRRGGGTSPSQWELITEPTPALFEHAVPPKPHKVTKIQALQDLWDAHESRIKALEDILENIIREEEGKAS